MTRWFLILATFVAGLAAATPAFAHASLLSSDPADSALLPQAPQFVTLTFNEQVSIVELKILDSAGGSHPLTDAHLEGTSVVATLPTGIPDGTDALSWRVISADSHPVGGTVIFSIGKMTATTAPADAPAAPGLYPAIWAFGFLLYVGLFVGIGGAFFAAWIAPGAMPRPARQIVVSALVIGVVSALVSLGLEGLDILGVGFGDLVSLGPWSAASTATYGATVLVAEIAQAMALVSMVPRVKDIARPLSGIALLATGLSLSLSGHASDAPPQSLSWAAVFLHAVGGAFWVGALAPLGVLLWQRAPGGRAALIRFSRSIPFAIAPLVVAGLLLVFVQFDAVSDLWTTDYGRILSAKLVAVAVLFGFAFANRFGLTDRVLGGDKAGTRVITRSIGIEVGLVVVILGLVALWRFTPPPRSVDAALAIATLPFTTHVMSDQAMANLSVSPGRVGPVAMSLDLTDLQLKPLAPKEVSVSLANPTAGLEPITRDATQQPDGTWRVEGLTLPVAGTWTVTVKALITDFKEDEIDGFVTIRP